MIKHTLHEREPNQDTNRKKQPWNSRSWRKNCVFRKKQREGLGEATPHPKRSKAQQTEQQKTMKREGLGEMEPFGPTSP